MDFAVIARARLTQSEFAALAGVSRVTVNTWVKGAMNPHRFISARVGGLLADIKLASETGYLPLDTGKGKRGKRGNRMEAITSAIAAARYNHKHNEQAVDSVSA